jgi:hypothetical protein
MTYMIHNLKYLDKIPIPRWLELVLCPAVAEQRQINYYVLHIKNRGR